MGVRVGEEPNVERGDVESVVRVESFEREMSHAGEGSVDGAGSSVLGPEVSEKDAIDGSVVVRGDAEHGEVHDADAASVIKGSLVGNGLFGSVENATSVEGRLRNDDEDAGGVITCGEAGIARSGILPSTENVVIPKLGALVCTALSVVSTLDGKACNIDNEHSHTDHAEPLGIGGSDDRELLDVGEKVLRDSGSAEKNSQGSCAVVDGKFPAELRVDEKSEDRLGTNVGSGNKEEVDELRNGENLDLNEARPFKKIQVFGDNSSLYVDFSAFLDGSGNSNLSPMPTDEVPSEGTGGQDSKESTVRFQAGDVVWIRTKNQSWWPGKICGQGNGSDNPTEIYQMKCLLVSYLGTSHTAWCLTTRLKPFHENFEDMAGQNKARSYLEAVEEAAAEFGNLLKPVMSCSCDSEIKTEASLLGREVGRLDKFSTSQFEPQNLLLLLKDLATTVSRPNLLELTVTKARLSAFYKSVGHSQLPMNQLKKLFKKNSSDSDSLPEEMNIDGLSEEASAAALGDSRMDDCVQQKGEDSSMDSGGTRGSDPSSNKRKRKKKKFFVIEGIDASPFVSQDNGKLTSDLESSVTMDMIPDCRGKKKSKYCGQKGSPSAKDNDEGRVHEEEESLSTLTGQLISKSSVKRFQKKWLTKYMAGNSMCNNPELINTSVADMLSELCFAAMDCRYPNERENFKVVDWFFSKYRMSVYQEESIYEMHFKNMIGGTGDVPVEKNKQEAHQSLLEAESVRPIQKKQKRRSLSESKIKSSTELSPGVTDVNMNATENCVDVEYKEQIGPAKPKKKQKKAARSPLGIPTNQTSSIPDLNDTTGTDLTESEAQLAATVADVVGTTGITDKSQPGTKHVPHVSTSHSPLAPAIKPCVVPNTPNTPAMPTLSPEPPTVDSVRKNIEKVTKTPAMSSATADAPPIDVIRKNLEMMTLMLEQAGNNIPPDVKAKLECDIQILLKKLVNLPSSASS